MEKILIGSPIKQKPSILSEFLSFLLKLHSGGAQLDFFFFDDNDNNDSKSLLNNFERFGSKKIVKEADSFINYDCNEVTHHWGKKHIQRVIRFKNEIIEYAKKHDYDYLLLVDSDICIHPQTVRRLLAAKKDIISEVFWTRWRPDEMYLPQVWNYDFYTFYLPAEMESQESITHNTLSQILKFQKPNLYKVGGLGALTLISKKALHAGVCFSFLYNLSWPMEDRHFCLRAIALGLELWADTNYPAYHIYRQSELSGLEFYKKYLEMHPEKLFLPQTRIVRKDPKLTLAMLVRNEEGRYLERVILSVLAHINNAVILDDASTDNTEKICRNLLKNIPLLYHRNKSAGFDNEIILRRQLWDLVISTDPDWILCLDADEVMENTFGQELKHIFNCFPADAVGFRLYDMWNEEQYRSDPLWNAHNRYFYIMLRYQPFFEYKWRETPLHCGRFPINILDQNVIHSHVRVKHLGWAREEDRKQKYNRYLELDPQGRFGNMAQYQSILDAHPRLEYFEPPSSTMSSILSINLLENRVDIPLTVFTSAYFASTVETKNEEINVDANPDKSKEETLNGAASLTQINDTISDHKSITPSRNKESISLDTSFQKPSYTNISCIANSINNTMHCKKPLPHLLSIVLLLSGQREYSRKCVESIQNRSKKPHEIIFVPPESSFAPPKWLRRMIKENKNCRLVTTADSVSKGFSAAVNAAVTESSGEFIVILDDSVMVTENWLTGLLEHLEKSEDTGIVGPMMVGEEGRQGVDRKVLETYEKTETHRDSSRLVEIEKAFENVAKAFRERNRYRRVAARSVAGSCVAFRKDLFTKIGPLDEQFTTARYALEDFCLRASVETFWNVIAGDTIVNCQRPTTAEGPLLFNDMKRFMHKWSNVETLNRLGPKLIAANVLSAVADLSERGDKEKALSALREGLQSNVGDEKLLFALVELLQDVKAFEDAYAVLQSMPDAVKQGPTWLYLSGSCKAGLQQYDEAARYAQEMLARDPSSAKGFNLSGLAAYGKKDFSGAEHLFRQAIDADPGYGEAYANLGAAKWAMNDHESAFGYLEKAFILSPVTESIAVSYHSVAVSLGRIEQAAIAFREASSLYPHSKRLKFMLGDLLLQMDRYSEAMEVLEEALLRFGVDNDTLTLAGALREKIGPHDNITDETHRDSSRLMETKKRETDRDSSRLVETQKQETHRDSIETHGDSSSQSRSLNQSQSVSLSVCIIVKNEEHNIGKCLHKIKPLADEMIVVDTGSTDRTKDIAKVFGAKVYDFAWTESFSDARNFSLSQATGDWLLVLDADEAIAPQDFPTIRELISTDSRGQGFKGSKRTQSEKGFRPSRNDKTKEFEPLNPASIAYSFVTRNYVMPITTAGWVSNEGKYLEQEAGTGWFPSKKVRLFPNDRRIRFESPVHEYVEGSLSAANIPIHDCSVPIHHYGKLDSGKIAAKGRQYYELGKAKLIERGEEDPLALLELAVQASELLEFEESIPWWQKFLLAMPEFWKGHYGLGNAYFRTGRFQEAVGSAAMAVQKAPGDAEWRDAALLFAYCSMPVGRAEESIRHMNRLLEKNPDDTLASVIMSTAFLFTGNKARGFELLRQLKEKKCDPSEFISEYARHFANYGKPSEALVLLEAAVQTGIATGEMMALKEECERKMKEADTQETHRDSSRHVETEQKNETRGDSSILIETQKQETHRDAIEIQKNEIRGDTVEIDRDKKSRSPISMNLNKSQSVSGSALQSPDLHESQGISLSLCMIVKNEEQNIRRALESIMPVADEMIVVDTGSTDRTKDIARELGAKVYDFPWTDSFADARNFGLSKATSDWILVLDADEVISQRDHEELRQLIRRDSIETHGDSIETQKKPEANRDSSRLVETKTADLNQSPNLNESQPVSASKTAYLFTTRNYVVPMNVSGYIGNDGTYPNEEAGTGWFPGEKVRLFPNDGRIRFDYPVHERVEPSLERSGISILRCEIPIHHYGKLDEEKWRAKNEYYYELGKKRLAEMEKTDCRALYDLAVQAAGIGRYREAVRHLSHVISLDPDFADAHASMGNVYYNLGQYENALSTYRKAIERDPNHEHAAVMGAQCELFLGRAEHAVRTLAPLSQREHITDKALLVLIAAHGILGDTEKAGEYMRKLSNSKAALSTYLEDFSRLLIKQGKTAEAQRLNETAEELRLRGLFNN